MSEVVCVHGTIKQYFSFQMDSSDAVKKTLSGEKPSSGKSRYNICHASFLC